MWSLMKYVNILLWVILVGHFVIGFDIVIKEKNVLENLTVDEPFTISIYLEDNYDVIHDQIINSNMCLMINGETCHCFPDTLDKTTVTLPIECVRLAERASWFWFSVKLLVPLVRQEPIGPTRILVSRPIFVSKTAHPKEPLLSLVLPLTASDVDRAQVLFTSLQKVTKDLVKQLFVVVPDDHVLVITNAITTFLSRKSLNFSILIVPEESLILTNVPSFPYAKQMAIKLLVAKFVSTRFYITLDADIVLLRSFSLDGLIFEQEHHHKSDTLYSDYFSSVYNYESKLVHPHWWIGSEALLNVTVNSSYVYSRWWNRGNMTDQCSGRPCTLYFADQGFGVTPSVLSTFGSLLTVAFVCESMLATYGAGPISSNLLDSTFCQRYWLGMFGMDSNVYATSDGVANRQIIWSEYTLYRITLDHFEIFDSLHFPEDDENLKGGHEQDARRYQLHCNNVWFSNDLPWKAEEAASNKRCLFSVIQSTSGVSPESVMELYLHYF